MCVISEQASRLEGQQLVRLHSTHSTQLPADPLTTLTRVIWAVLFREGGVRGISFVSGGFLPEKQRGTHHQGYIHVCDWLATFS